ncbi:MAG: carboxypeptidase-like regulatory domain-containing protein, partial [Lutibacter sp.]|nr:carboxypeptidase-like regulatory domain-containing protein [Lutibacter sp.]
MKNIYRFYALLLFPLGLTAQHFVTGKVVDNGLPLEGASVYFQELSLGTITDEKGTFKMAVDHAAKYELTVSFTGYQPVKIPVDLA